MKRILLLFFTALLLLSLKFVLVGPSPTLFAQNASN